MRFAHQQFLLLAASLGPLELPRLLQRLGFIDEKLAYPEAVQILMMMVVAVALTRLLFWLSWGSERGRRFQRSVGVNPELVLNSIGSPLYQWWFHIDKNGKDLDAPR